MIATAPEEKDNEDVEGKLLGNVDDEKYSEGGGVTRAMLDVPFENPESIIHIFCTSCNGILELNQEGLSEYAKAFDLKIPGGNDFSDLYIKVGQCKDCQDETGAFKAELLRKPSK